MGQKSLVLGVCSAIPLISGGILGSVVLLIAWDVLKFTNTATIPILQLVAAILCPIIFWMVYKYQSKEKILLKTIPQLAGIVLIINIFIAVCCLGFITFNILQSNGDRFATLVAHYPFDAEIKHMVDQMQCLLECCGGNNITDWFYIQWNHIYIEPRRSIQISHPGWDAVPFSCCSRTVFGPCMHENLKTYGTYSLSAKGCGPAVTLAICVYLAISFLLAVWAAILMATFTSAIKTGKRDSPRRKNTLGKSGKRRGLFHNYKKLITRKKESPRNREGLMDKIRRDETKEKVDGVDKEVMFAKLEYNMGNATNIEPATKVISDKLPLKRMDWTTLGDESTEDFTELQISSGESSPPIASPSNSNNNEDDKGNNEGYATGFIFKEFKKSESNPSIVSSKLAYVMEHGCRCSNYMKDN